jgi:DNA-binding transcriptional LysR family regulator
MDRLDAMAAFVAVADLRGFAPAARRLGLSPSAVTRLVAALEERVGARLLQRTTRSVTLTDAGGRYLARARRILADVAEADGEAQAERATPTGRLVVTAPNTFGRLHVAPLVSAFAARYPEVLVELRLSDGLVNLVEDGVDVAVRIGVLRDASYVVRSAGATRRVVVASPGYLEARRAPRAPDRLAGHGVIHCTAIAATPEWAFAGEGGARRVPLSPTFVTNSVDAALVRAEAGGGLTMVLAYQALPAIRAGRLRVVLEAFEPPPLPVQIVYPSTRQLTAKVRAFSALASETCDWRFVAF